MKMVVEKGLSPVCSGFVTSPPPLFPGTTTESSILHSPWSLPQLSPSVLQALTRIVGLQQQQDQDNNIDVEVTFTSCWEAYRRRLLRVLKARYHEIVQDMRRVDLCEACVYVRSHIADVSFWCIKLSPSQQHI